MSRHAAVTAAASPLTAAAVAAAVAAVSSSARTRAASAAASVGRDRSYDDAPPYSAWPAATARAASVTAQVRSPVRCRAHASTAASVTPPSRATHSRRASTRTPPWVTVAVTRGGWLVDRVAAATAARMV